VLLAPGAVSAEPASRDDLKIALHQIDKRFEQVDKRLDLILWVIGFATLFTSGVLSYLILRVHRVEDDSKAAKLTFSGFIEMIHSARTQEKGII